MKFKIETSLSSQVYLPATGDLPHHSAKSPSNNTPQKPTSADFVTTTVKLPKALHKRLRMAVVEREVSASQIVEDALEAELKRRR